LGRLLRALGDSPVALATGGAGVHVTQVLVFCVSAFLAAVSGSLLGVSMVRADGSLFDPTLSLMLLAGLGRTFQQMRLYDSLTVRQNVELGREAAYAGRSPLSQVFTSRGQRHEIAEAAGQAMALCGIEHLADTPGGTLSTGQRRLVELARCLTGPFDILLLDEPSSGLDATETVAFGDLLERVVQQRACGVLLVEHDMSLVMRVCSCITVLDFGHVVFEGTPTEVADSPVVRTAYLGSEGTATAELEREAQPEVEGSRP